MGEESSLGIKGFYKIIRKRRKMIAAITIVCALLSGILSYFVLAPVYQAQTTIIVGKPQSNDTSQQYNDVMMYQNLVKTYSRIAQSKSVAKAAASKLNSGISADAIQKDVTVTSEDGTQILTIMAENNNAQEAVNIVNAVTTSFVEESKKVFPTGSDIQVMDSPEFPKTSSKPRKALNIVVSILAGLMASIGFAYMLEYLDRTIKDENDVEKYLDMPVIGIIPKEI
jgi:capsular polysaccharide biosynthesis protein